MLFKHLSRHLVWTNFSAFSAGGLRSNISEEEGTACVLGVREKRKDSLRAKLSLITVNGVVASVLSLASKST